MHDFILILHFLGLTIGAGTSFYMLGLALHARRLKNPEAAKKIMLGAGAAISGIGLMGLILLLASGYFLLMQPGVDINTLNWAFWMKMAMVAAILFYTVMMKIFAIKAKRREGEEGIAAMKKMKRFAAIGPFLTFLVISFAVLAFR
ncbi:hypothetical protein MNBD_GAMMA17-170 [hydrothermal vent metagenome]|uniref:DUF2269 family protein n=1 Tax=hydrothermal vent metagenome TaxID=652676 RepID=A0A3B0ZA79_9ZZZZ